MANKMNSARKAGGIIEWDENGRPVVPDNPIIPHIEGDGIGPDIWAAAQPVFDAALEHVYQGKRHINWYELLTGEKAQKVYGPENPLPKHTLEDIVRYGIVLKGPLTTPVGSGFRSLNVALRQKLDLYTCIRPIRYFPGVPPHRYFTLKGSIW